MANEAGFSCEAYSALSNYTAVDKGYPATVTGSCTKLSVYVAGIATNTDIQFAFFTASGNNLTSTNYVTVTSPANVASHCQAFEAPGDFTAFSVNSGEYLGCYTPSGFSQHFSFTDVDGGGVWYSNADRIPCTAQAFSLDGDSDGITSLLADITASGGGETSSGSGSITPAGTYSRHFIGNRLLTGNI